MLHGVCWVKPCEKTAWVSRLIMAPVLPRPCVVPESRAKLLLKSGRDPVDVICLRNYGLRGLIDLVVGRF